MSTNEHLMHLEDIPLYKGSEGLKLVEKFMTFPVYVSLKFDGSPAILIGRDTHGFFIGTKTLLRSKPVKYRTMRDLDVVTPDALQRKLKYVYMYTHTLDFDGILQGDFLFGIEDLKYDYSSAVYSFQQNVLQYHIPEELFHGIVPHIGILWHTQYIEGKTVYNNTNWPENEYIWNPNQGFRYIETENLVPHNISSYYKIADDIVNIDEFGRTIEIYKNHCIRTEKTCSINDLIIWIESRYNNIINNRKTQQSKVKYETLKSNMLTYIAKDKSHFTHYLNLLNDISLGKQIIINKLNKQFDEIYVTVEDKNNNVINTQHEGFVISIGNEACKLVNRDEFSRYNFSPNIKRAWDKPNENERVFQ